MKAAAAFLASLVLVMPAAVRGTPPVRDFGAVFSPDGRIVAFVHVVGSTASKASGPSISRPGHRCASPPTIPAKGVESWQPSWSPDGQTIAYSRFQTCFRCTAIWLMNSDGTSPHQIYDTDFKPRRPVFSPDGTRLALSIANDLVIDLDGHSIVAGGGAYTIWSPRGTYIAYTGNGLWIRKLQTGSIRRLTPYMGGQVAWSQDGKWIAAGLRNSVGLVHARDGSHLRKLPASQTNGGTPSFSHGFVVYAHSGECGIDIARQNGTHARRLTRAC